MKGRDAEEESKRLQEELNSRGLDDDSVKAIQKISRSDRIDFDVSYSDSWTPRAIIHRIFLDSSYLPSLNTSFPRHRNEVQS